VGASSQTLTKTRLTPGRRLTRGLTYTLLGPVDVTLGTVGLGVDGAQSAARLLRRRPSKGELAKEVGAAQETLAQELSAAQQAIAGLPQAYAKARKPKRRKRGLIIAAAAVLGLAGGAVAFSIVRRSMQPDPSPRPPSVDVDPKP
jgi:Cell wall synthesis protein CwsA